ncbi:hypothetical protein OPKNFCMD_3908 [Methylobacterium crusticola]|uniref:Antifreeze protein n=1 Tax=Methylobacterium crusticola TaxID=1697972 RepID=A0ABQ4R2U8_9HYPH|nr:hypothetical protein [Methylobacterium crusticola]GJD51156.1 hypothetical protein OPKNFCMD_3908 [Methylobacterium crusticola]
MLDGVRQRIGLGLLLGVLSAPPALAQQDARPWTDPPARPAETAPAPARAVAAKPAPARAVTAKPAPARGVAAKPAPAPVRAARPAASPAPAPVAAVARTRREVARTARREPAIRPRPVARAAPAPRLAAAARARSRLAAIQPFPPHPLMMRAMPRAIPVAVRPWPGHAWSDERAMRLQQAREAGFLVMRRTTWEDLDGRRIHTLRPFDDDEE